MASAKGFAYGVTAGEVSASSAILWTRADKAGGVKLELSKGNSKFGEAGDISKSLSATSKRDNTVQIKVGHLKAGTSYFYRFSQGTKRSDVGRFMTAPLATKAQTISFGLSGDADAQPAPGETKPYDR